MKAVLHHQGIDCASPRGCIKEAVAAGLVQDGEGWICMLEARNRTAHLYSRDDAVAVYDEIKGRYLGLLAGLEEAIRLHLED